MVIKVVFDIFPDHISGEGTRRDVDRWTFKLLFLDMLNYPIKRPAGIDGEAFRGNCPLERVDLTKLITDLNHAHQASVKTQDVDLFIPQSILQASRVKDSFQHRNGKGIWNR